MEGLTSRCYEKRIRGFHDALEISDGLSRRGLSDEKGERAGLSVSKNILMSVVCEDFSCCL